MRQAVIAARELDPVVERLTGTLGLREPFHDEGVGYFGLRNAVFALADGFLEVVSPVREDTSAGRLLDRRGRDVCGYMTMFQVRDLAPARVRAEQAGVREVFAVELDDIDEVHLHPREMGGAIVSLSTPTPVDAWRWGGPGWAQRSAPLRLTGAALAVNDSTTVSTRWRTVIGGLPGIRFAEDPGDPGLVEITLGAAPGGPRTEIDFGGVRVVVQ